MAETEPWVARDQAMKDPWRHDIQIVLANDSVEEFRVLLHYERREVKLALCHKPGLFG